MATHSSILVWRILWTEEPRGLQSKGPQRVRHDWVTTHSLTLQPHGLQHTSLSVLHHLPEFAQTYVYWISDAIQTSHPLSSPILSALSLAQTQGLFQWVCSLNQVAKVLELRLQHQLSSVEFSCSVVSDSLWSHGLKHARLPSITNSQSLLKLMSIE